ncbi:MAG: zinc metallopeptidase [Ruminococcaceae bacterium]|nr:zinc metallopeptidase [Oscillospiraceae bacterium]
MPFFYYFDIWMLPVLVAVIWSMWASSRVNSTFKKYSKMSNSRGLTGEECARAVLRSAGITDVRVEKVSGNLTDHFDPRSKVIRLSDSVFSSTSVSALGVAAHEAGHAVQHEVGYFPIKVRTAIIPICQFGSNLAMPLVLLGIILSIADLAYLGVLLFGLSALFQLVTLPVEFNASRRAINSLESQNILVGNEVDSAKKVLSAAAMTYVAALAVSLANLLRLFMLVNRNSRR